ncbi:ribonuclease HI [Victivallaceae bacterium BBE-744-WT-12]|uniref:Ribonuclease H n=1 Tax=Victivallis lenta TaxID=2606640 RepID=A0A844G1U3_9BACT|nr:ribonuclease HI [Victivallis lenta]AVM45750.1 ribonuclease HI [Victivallales bacterium CCUG 44730]MST97123.1 ribonuclease HI [Victivallis lenta]HBP06483.1 ribonuclease HI [Lentisphaeria bacterium]HCH87227.1 ribonuclease HI [Lentisphaeria bacterium]
MKEIVIYTDGACKGNPGPGGWGAILEYGVHRRELCGGFAPTTNNRMELYAAIAALDALREPCRVTLYSDSSYLVNAVAKGWLARWCRNNWRRADRQPVANADLWRRLQELLGIHLVTPVWVKGHADNAGNARCDELASGAALRPGLPPDTGFAAAE